MKAVILLEPGRLELRDIPLTTCKEGEVLIKVMACGICSSDIKMAVHGHRELQYPRILGHEIVGIVIESGSRLFKEGDRVQVAPGLRCGRCKACLKGMDNQCRNRKILGFTHDGGFAQYIMLPLEGPFWGSLNLIPEDTGLFEAVLAEPLACCINAQKKAKVSRGDKVLIIGGGVTGHLHSIVATILGAEDIFLSEPLTYRRSISTGAKISRRIDPTEEDLYQIIIEETDGYGADVIILACSDLCPAQFMRFLAPGGRLCLFSGIPHKDSKAYLDLNTIHYQELQIVGAYGCSALHNREAVSIISSKRFSLKNLITRSIPLEELQDVLMGGISPDEMKIIVEVEKWMKD